MENMENMENMDNMVKLLTNQGVQIMSRIAQLTSSTVTGFEQVMGKLDSEWRKQCTTHNGMDVEGLLVYNLKEKACCNWNEKKDDKWIIEHGYCEASNCDTKKSMPLSVLDVNSRCEWSRLQGTCHQNIQVMEALEKLLDTNDGDVLLHRATDKNGWQIRSIILGWVYHLTAVTQFNVSTYRMNPDRNGKFPKDERSNDLYRSVSMVETIRGLVFLFQTSQIGYLDVVAGMYLRNKYQHDMIKSSEILLFAKLRLPLQMKVDIANKVIQVHDDVEHEYWEKLMNVGISGDLGKQIFNDQDIRVLYTMFFVLLIRRNNFHGLEMQKEFDKILVGRDDQAVTVSNLISAALIGNNKCGLEWQSPDVVAQWNLDGYFRQVFIGGTRITEPIKHPMTAVTFTVANGISLMEGGSALTEILKGIAAKVALEIEADAMAQAVDMDLAGCVTVLTYVLSMLQEKQRSRGEDSTAFKTMANFLVDETGSRTIIAEAEGKSYIIMRNETNTKMEKDLASKMRVTRNAFNEALKSRFDDTQRPKFKSYFLYTMLTAACIQLAFFGNSASAVLAKYRSSVMSMQLGEDPIYEVYYRVVLMVHRALKIDLATMKIPYNESVRQEILKVTEGFKDWVRLAIYGSICIAIADQYQEEIKKEDEFFSNVFIKQNDGMLLSCIETAIAALGLRPSDGMLLVTQPGQVASAEVRESNKSYATGKQSTSKTSKLRTAEATAECLSYKSQGYLAPGEDCNNNPEIRVRLGSKRKANEPIARRNLKRATMASNPSGKMPSACIPAQKELLFINSAREIFEKYFQVADVADVTSEMRLVSMTSQFAIYESYADHGRYMARVTFEELDRTLIVRELTALRVLEARRAENRIEELGVFKPCVFVEIPSIGSHYRFYTEVIFSTFDTTKSVQYTAIFPTLGNMLWINAFGIAHTHIRPESLYMTPENQIYLDGFGTSTLMVKDSYGPNTVMQLDTERTYKGRQTSAVAFNLYQLPDKNNKKTNWTRQSLAANDMWGLCTSILDRMGLVVLAEAVVKKIMATSITQAKQVFDIVDTVFKVGNIKRAIDESYEHSDSLTRELKRKVTFDTTTTQIRDSIDSDTRNVIALMMSLSLLEWDYMLAMREFWEKIPRLVEKVRELVIKLKTPVPDRIRELSLNAPSYLDRLKKHVLPNVAGLA